MPWWFKLPPARLIPQEYWVRVPVSTGKAVEADSGVWVSDPAPVVMAIWGRN